ncbi:MAG TPA: MBL fold metallo-hydrolase [Mycobacterium sp.]|nr:MBL fold metallo-hydrolase [Mycobacterium sp.]
MTANPIHRVVTHGTFELDGGSWEVDNNIWIVGDDSDVVVFDAAHTAVPIVDAIAGRNVVAVVCTHAHNDHITVAPELGAVFSGDTLFRGGPGATGRSYSHFPTILNSISGKRGKLPADTVVCTGHGDSTTIGDEIVHWDEWVGPS